MQDEGRDVEKDPQSQPAVTVVDDKSQPSENDRDPNLVDFDGPDDPANAMNWSGKKKLANCAVIAFITLLTPLGSSMFAPGVPDVMKDFHSSSPELASFVVSVYLLGYCFGPLLLAPLSEMYGRLPIYHACNVLYIIWSVACALAPNLASLIIFRLFAGLAGSCPLTVGPASFADMIPQEKRGTAMSIWALGSLIGPVVGPIAGGYMAQDIGWRWTFWVLAIAAGVATIFGFVVMRESYANIILQRKVERLRKETGNPNLRSVRDTGRTPQELFKFSIVRPLKMLFLSPIVFLLSLYVGVVYGYLYLLFTTIPTVFQLQYGFSSGSVGLAYLGIGVGSFLGLMVIGSTSDRLMKQLTAKNGGTPKPEYRLPLMVIGGFFVPVSLFWYGWSAEYELHWIMPIIGTAILGIGMIIAFMATSTYLIDAFTVYSASVMAANTVFRSLAGAVLPLAGGRMYENLGLGWGNSLLAFIALGMVPLPFIFWKYGERIRTSKLFKVEF